MEFVTKKIALGVAEIIKGEQSFLEFGNLHAQRDWGFTKEYVQDVHKMLQNDIADDYIMERGRSKSIREFAELCFKCIDRNIT